MKNNCKSVKNNCKSMKNFNYESNYLISFRTNVKNPQYLPFTTFNRLQKIHLISAQLNNFTAFLQCLTKYLFFFPQTQKYPLTIRYFFPLVVAGLRILAFPCDQFNHQEPGNSEEIQCFARDHKVKFDLFEKIDVNGKEAHPLWQYLKKEQGGMLFDGIKWNFTKFIVDKNGKPVERHSPNTSPKEMLKNLEAFL